jgi:hypothetical protein
MKLGFVSFWGIVIGVLMVLGRGVQGHGRHFADHVTIAIDCGASQGSKSTEGFFYQHVSFVRFFWNFCI